MKIVSAIVMAALVIPSAAMAHGTHRQMGKHQHGHGEFNLAIDGGKVVMELHATGADIVGFEHTPKTAREKSAIEQARKRLAEGTKLFVTPAAAGCKMVKASVNMIIGTEKAEGKSGKDKHAHGHGHDHRHGTPEEGHSEFQVQYVLQCDNPGKLTTLRFDFFKRFPRAKELEVQAISAKRQARFEVTPASPQIDLRKLMAR